ncbi:MAG: hypothetical protein JWQ35_1153 [Bacteriovoracaceae bacterium]|nr:hypothetical protein [Bacteriovoracaceae bacterium]
MKPPFSSEDLVRISTMMEVGLKSGRDWISILEWISKSDHKIKIRDHLRGLLRRLKIDSLENTLLEEREKSPDLLWKMFVEILLQANRGSLHLSNLFKSFSEIGRSVIQLRRKEKSLLFIPRFQSCTSLLMTLGFAWGFPLMAPGLFPTFLTLKRPDLFYGGLGIILIGFILLHWLCSRPRRTLGPLLSTSFFFYFLSVHVESGLDLVSSWYRSLEAVPLPENLKQRLSRPGLGVESMESFLLDLSTKLKGSWPGILTGLIWAKNSGIGLSRFLKEISDKETERLLFSWEDEIRKLTMISLLPLAILVFPGTMFLLVGPQLLELMTTL